MRSLLNGLTSIWLRRPWVKPLVLLILTALCNLTLLLSPSTLVQSWAALFLAVLLPGYLAGQLWLRRTVGLGERLVLSVGLGFALLILLLLGLSYLPGGLNWGTVALTFSLLLFVLILAVWRWSQPGARPQSRTTLVWSRWELIALLVLLSGAAYLRFTNIGYSELHGDEALVALRANDVIQGWGRALFIHKKGPGEILVAVVMYVLTGRLTEYAAHLPFAFASWTAVFATYLLGRRWFGAVGGWWAGALVAVDGYLMAFGRMLQYQSLIFLLVVLTVLAMQQGVDRPKAPARYLWLAAFLMAVGLLAHYEAAVAAVPALWLLILLWQAQQGRWWRSLGWTLRQMAGPLLVGTVILALFYVPFVLDPEFFRDTFAYLVDYRLAGHTAPEGLSIIVGRSTLYSSSYYFWTLALLTVVGLLRLYWRYLPRRAAIGWILLLAAVLIALLWDATAFFALPARLALLLWLLSFAPAWLAPSLPATERTAWLWFGAPLLGVIFFVIKPGTHVYIFFIPWALVSGMVVAQGWAALTRRWGALPTRLLLAPALLCLALLFGNYARWLFVVNDPEILRTWDENRPAGYPTSFTTPVFESIFGFPIRNGWKTVAALYDQRVMQGRFQSNDRFSMVPDWYLRGHEYCGRDEPTYFLLVPYPLPYDRPIVAEQRRQLAADYYLWGIVNSNAQPHMEIYARRDQLAIEDTGTPRSFAEESYTPYFNTRLLAPFTPNGPLGVQAVPNPTNFHFGAQGEIALLGYTVDRNWVASGDEVEVTLYWQTAVPLDHDYYVSIQVIDLSDAHKVGQRDGEPGCNRFPTSLWVPGDRLFDRYYVPIDAAARSGDYRLYVTMYQMDDLTGPQIALPVTDPSGQPVPGASLTTITVAP